MTRDEAKKLLPVIQAWADGKAIQARRSPSEPWADLVDAGWHNCHEYRIKPEPRRVWVAMTPNGSIAAWSQAGGGALRDTLPTCEVVEFIEVEVKS